MEREAGSILIDAFGPEWRGSRRVGRTPRSIRFAENFAAGGKTYCIGGDEYKGRITRLSWLSTRSFSSGLEQTMEKVPIRSPYRPKFYISVLPRVLAKPLESPLLRCDL